MLVFGAFGNPVSKFTAGTSNLIAETNYVFLAGMDF